MPLPRVFPSDIVIAGELHRFENILKQDIFSINLLYRNQRGDGQVLKISELRVPFGFLLNPFSMLMSRREYRIYQKLAGIQGVPALGPRYGRRGFFHQYVKGVTLFELPKGRPLPEQFWNDLRAILERIHERRIVHLDFHKLGNIIQGEDGSAYILDFQISLPFDTRPGWIGARLNALFEFLKKEDHYHLYKHKRRFQREAMTEDELRLAQRSPVNEWFFRFIGEPYRKIKRLIYPKGSNETLWYKWKKGRGQDRQIP
jgi:hypothetical protein